MKSGEGGLITGASFGLIAGLLFGLGLLIALLPRHPSAAEAARECEVAAGVARSLGVREVVSTLKEAPFDCRDAFVRAGLELADPELRGPDGRTGWGVQLSRPSIFNHDRAVIDMSVSCGVLCGRGERITARRSGEGWVAVGREQTWIS